MLMEVYNLVQWQIRMILSYQMSPLRARKAFCWVIFVVVILVPKILLTQMNNLVPDLQLPF